MITLHARTDRRTPSSGATQAAIARAVSVKRFLVGQGVPEGKIRLMYRTTGDFVNPNRTATERAANRRVEIEFR
ncbi:OmpA family protein [Asticcacaulis sp. W401b]|uniref:OmpA family protein n=1 Tax=Asticcacaulis sp. W401b TaxID=3388666 RepID=UPI003970A432